ncbi:MAG: hypothetical protein IKR78_06245 [Dehalococcoidales bacterium]|nr:hypothetical protein [Dehalococcoidales bacterium]
MKKILFVLLAVIMTVTMCACSSTEQTNTVASIDAPAKDYVHVTSFYESDACFCLNLAQEWIRTIVLEEYKSYVDSGKLKYDEYDTTDSSNAAIKAEYDAPSYALYITSDMNGEWKYKNIASIWLYTDTTGKNDVLKKKFHDAVVKELDASLNAIGA